MSIGLLILILVVAGFLLGRAGSGGWALAAFVLALLLFVSTPTGRDLPGQVMDGVHSVDGTVRGVVGP